ncbi:polysaccharide pyruvyl transferase family protein [Microbacterium allomyrinae]|jgi:polysaccharide pyruvyl transferase WcaK-like protein|uniref:Polysaccharide pyruvyl transferase family protein n=1 Tax=Microbacterium allomyrinae TaxID=2830666 RepID=A0A9X1LXS7_9MICO|nr:polysaccharide pyruvyl transferase family protein [Microbacterium allomyrinae]MCC2034060.1 polysaccharide pyruvyl transferase family protein [Microbacterium allomyrinae]
MIVVVDPGAATTNLGDKIIAEAVERELIAPLRNAKLDVHRVPLHGTLTDGQRELIAQADDVIVSGTNLLSDHMRFRRSWQWDRKDIELTAGKLTTFGVGWWQYQRSGIDPLSARWLRSLRGTHAWAVRDEYSARRLGKAGVHAAHTTCPTLWSCSTQTLPSNERRAVVTLTDYNQERAADEQLVRALNSRFDEVLYWPQGPGDAVYLTSLAGVGPEQILAPTLEAFDAALLAGDTAYVGLRLHGGVRAIQLGVPSLILSVDNRAREISKSVDLAAPSRFAVNEIEHAMRSGEERKLAIPTETIDGWRRGWTG